MSLVLGEVDEIHSILFAVDGGLHGVGGGDGDCGDYGNREMLVIG